MISKEENFAYIDGANLYKGINDLGWDLDYKRFRIWLSEKYGAKKAYIFLGLIPRYKELYKYLQEGPVLCWCLKKWFITTKANPRAIVIPI